jgi:predicted ABC-type ATPase
MDKQLYIISGCNGAGKTTASFTILPDVLDCKEFINADEIARGLSPFQPEKVGIEAGRIMLNRIQELLSQGKTFAFETTLATKSYKNIIQQAKSLGYTINLLFFSLNSIELAIDRVKTRVLEGGHHIPSDIVARRYSNGLKNLFEIYSDIVDNLTIFNNSNGQPELIAKKDQMNVVQIIDLKAYNYLKSVYNEKR